ncbi:MAG: DUF222 domain-containing protein [Actinomycetota bacterium]
MNPSTITPPPPRHPPFAALPTEQLEAWICQMSANLSAAEHDWLVAIAEFDTRNGWHGWGIASCAHWLSWQVGLDHRTAREKLRVGHALRRFPAIAAAMASGQLSYSKVRALTRIATPQNEATLAMWGLAATSNQVERIVAGYCRSLRSQRDRTQQQWAGRAMHHSTDDDGGVTITLKLPADAAIELLSAVEHFVVPAAPLDDGTREPLSARRADAAVQMARVAHTADTAPRGGGEGGKSAAPAVVTLHVDLQTLLDDADTDPDTGPDTGPGSGPHAGRQPDHDGPGDGAPEHRTCHVDGAPGVVPHPLAVTATTALRLLCGADLEALLHQARHPIGVTERRALVRGRLRRHVLLRDGTCRYPDCSRAAALDVHHIHHRHHGGTNHTDNLVSLCAYHHRLVHEGGWRITGNPDNGVLTFTSPTGHSVSTARTDQPCGTAEAVLAKGRTAADGRGQWAGDRLDLGVAVMCLHQLDGPDPRQPDVAPRSTQGPSPADCSCEHRTAPMWWTCG